MSGILANKDVNAATHMQQVDTDTKSDIKSMEYHRQVLASKMAGAESEKAFISPSDSIMSPCTAKLSAYRGKQAFKAKPKSLFAKTSSKNIDASNMFGDMNKDGAQ